MRRYEVLRRLSAGGMGTVYLGRLVAAHGFSRLVALKSMHPQYALDPNFSAMFVDEARLTALLHHPNIVPTIDVVSTDESLVLVMEYVEGSSLWSLLQASRVAGVTLPVAVACAIVHDVLSGLHHAHEARDEEGRPLGIIHRDVSPQNVIVGRDGLARVLDFGIAKARGAQHASHTGAVRGKVAYMAPEQLCGRELDRRADIYAAGVVLWEALTSQRLFEGENLALVTAVLSGTVAAPSTVRPEVGAELDAVVLRALAKNPADRFPSAAAMADALSRAVALANRTAVTAWVSKDATLASADASWFRQSARSSTSAMVIGSQHATASSLMRGSRSDTLAPASSEHFDHAPARSSSWTGVMIAALAAVGALGVLVGARTDVSLSRQAHAAEPQAAVNALPEASPVVIAPSAPAAPAVSAPSSAEATQTAVAPAASTAAPSGSAPRRATAPAAAIRPRQKANRFDANLGF